MYDRRDTNGTELRAFAGNFLFSTGANEFAGRFTEGHFDIPVRNCTIALDGDAGGGRRKARCHDHASSCCTASAARAGRRSLPALGPGPGAGLAAARLRRHADAGRDQLRRLGRAAARSAWTPSGIPRIDLIGHSIGGMLALDFALRFPERVRGLVLYATTPAFGGRDPALRRGLPGRAPGAARCRAGHGGAGRGQHPADARAPARRHPWREAGGGRHGRGARGRLPRHRPLPDHLQPARRPRPSSPRPPC